MSHSVTGSIEDAHSHVIEIEFLIRAEKEDFLSFSSMDRLLQDNLSRYQNKYLNEFDEFDGQVTMEGICETLYKTMEGKFADAGWLIMRLSVSETPLRTYSIVAEEI